ncbi:MAG: hypothetical protein ACREMA_11440, partial [Longimicrobiales bacterium]
MKGRSLFGNFSALRRLQTGLLTAFAALALILAALGIFGLVHYAIGACAWPRTGSNRPRAGPA